MGKNCGNKIQNTCTGSLQYSTCVQWEGEVNPQSSLVDDSCLDQEIVDQDQYDQLEDIWNEIDLSALGKSCLTYVLEDGKTIVKNVLLKYEQEICELKQKQTSSENINLCDINIADCDIDLKCLALPCNQDIVTLADLLNAMIVKICETP